MIFVWILAGGFVHFCIGGLWYSRVLFSRPWMAGLGITDADIEEARVNVGLALAASAALSFVQAGVIAWLLVEIGETSLVLSVGLATAVAVAFSVLPMIKDAVWTGRSMAVVAIDGGYEVAAGIVVVVLFWFAGIGTAP